MYTLFAAPPTVTAVYRKRSSSVFTLGCSSTGSAAANVTWTRNGITLHDCSKYKHFQTVTSRYLSTYYNELQICDLPEHLGGNYSCIVSNILGSSSGWVHVPGMYSDCTCLLIPDCATMNTYMP